ncbi:MAG: hypothetical protein IJC99_00695 [Clostridia bacterium]|nr:hypothetical protein [Clostridia bacterium]
MKKRKIAIAAFLLCACMLIGVGFAAISRELYVVGTVNVSNSSLDVFFVDADTDADTTDNFCTEAKLVDQTHVRMTTDVMNTKGQKAVAVFVIENQMPDKAASIEHKAHTMAGGLNSSYFRITREFIRVDEAHTDVIIDTENSRVDTLPAGRSVILKITIELDQSITADLSGTSQLELTGEFLATSIG